MRNHWASLLVLAITAGTASVVVAQEGLRGPGMRIGGFHLIAMPAVQEELELTESQKERAATVAQRMNQRFQQDMGKLKGLKSDEEMKRLSTLAGPHYEEGMKELRGFLKPNQLDRFDQILFQMRGPMAMLEPRIVQQLQVTNAQAKQVAELVAQATNDQQAAVKSEGQGTKAAAVKVEAIAAAANEKAYEILSPEQQRTWSRIVGKPFRPDVAGGNKAFGTENQPRAGSNP